MKEKTLSALRPGDAALVGEVRTPSPLREHFTALGLIAGTPVTCLLRSPFGDPSAYLIRGALVAIRREDAETVALNTG